MGNINIQAKLKHFPTLLNPFQVVAMDHMGRLPKTIRGNRYILVFIDHLTKFHELIPVRDRTATTVAEALRSFIITQHSCPEVLLSDNAPEFTSELLKSLCSFYGIKKCEVHPYKPSSNGMVEKEHTENGDNTTD